MNHFTPRPYQKQIIDHISNHPVAFCLCAMGSGKTAATLESFKKIRPRRVLIIAPIRVAKHTWPAEIAKWSNFTKYTHAVAVGTPKQRMSAFTSTSSIVIINVENVPWMIDNCAKQLGDFDCVVIDESSAFKNPSTKRFKAIKKLVTANMIKHWILLTATPTPNTLLEAWPQMFILDQGQRLGKSMTAYKQRYFESDYMGYNWTPREGAEDIIRSKISELAVVVESYDGLPERVDLREEVQLPANVMGAYRQLEKDAIQKIGDDMITAVNAAVLIGKLQQIAGGAVYDEEGKYHIYHDAKLEALQSLVEQAEGENLLIAYNYQHELERILSVYPDAVNVKDKGAIDRWNKGEIKMLLAHPKSMAHGINAQDGGRRIIWFSPTWSNELKMQFDARLHRQGQKDRVYVHTIVATDTVDERIIAAVRDKKSAQEIVLATVKKYRG